MSRTVANLPWAIVFIFSSSIVLLAAPGPEVLRPDIDSVLGLDRPTPLQPKRERSESEEDRLQATVQFAQGRILFQRQDFAGALRNYQRAVRFDPTAATILHEIVPLAFELNRSDVAARYAVLAAERDPRDPQLLVQLGGLLASQKEHRRALGMFTRSLAMQNEETPVSVVTRMESGRLHFLLQEYPDAARNFAIVSGALDQPAKSGLKEEQRRALLDQPDKLYTLFGEAALRAGELDDAARYFERANDAKKNDPLLAYHQARIDLERKDWPSAIKHLETYLSANLSEAGMDAHHQLERAYGQKHADPAEADVELLRILESYLDRFPSNVPLAFFVAEKYRAAKSFSKAEPLLQRLRKLQPATDLYVSIVELYLDQDNLEQVLETLAQYGSAAGPLDSIRRTLAGIVADEKRVQNILAIARRRLKDEGIALAAAQVAAAAHRFDEADELFSVALDGPAAPRLQILTIWGLAMFSREQPERAVRAFRRVIDERLKPEENPTFLNYLVGALVMANQVDDALKAVDQLIAATPKTPRFQARRAWILYRGKRLEESESAYRDLLARFDSDYSSPEIREVMRETRLALSNIAVHRKNIAQAEEWLEQVLDEFPEDTSAFNDLGYLWADQSKHLLRAHRMIDRAVSNEPTNKAYRDSLGWVLFRMGRYQQALVELQKAVDAGDPDGVVLDHMGDCLEKTDHKEEARAHWRRALEAFKKEPDLERQQLVETKLQAP